MWSIYCVSGSMAFTLWQNAAGQRLVTISNGKTAVNSASAGVKCHPPCLQTNKMRSENEKWKQSLVGAPAHRV